MGEGGGVGLGYEISFGRDGGGGGFRLCWGVCWGVVRGGEVGLRWVGRCGTGFLGFVVVGWMVRGGGGE